MITCGQTSRPIGFFSAGAPSRPLNLPSASPTLLHVDLAHRDGGTVHEFRAATMALSAHLCHILWCCASLTLSGVRFLLPRLSAFKEFAFMSALHKKGFPVPKPYDVNRHCIAMQLAHGYQLNSITALRHPATVRSPPQVCLMTPRSVWHPLPPTWTCGICPLISLTQLVGVQHTY